ncbi:MAG TPA: cysteine--tRNA ligase [Burkholderiales bacterium]|nr:cysteine--tRNA ligase [Burkholderiales bacterium]
MKIFNSLSKQKEDFIPIKHNEVKMYICGQTVYDYCHLGHARKAVVFDMVRRWFIASGYKVVFVENITDIDDKIIRRAEENGETIYQLTERYIKYMHEDFASLGVMRPDHEPKATEYVTQMVYLIQDLINKNYAYQAINGDVYYRVRKFVGYGKLSGKSLDDLRAGERVDVDLNKEDPLDFVLWKASKENEVYWDSPLGNGRPGWHIECSAMSEEILGKNFDIHGGGQDLQFPHHENEIAQSEAHNGCQFANYWMHNGFLNVNDEKMSKSLGNFFTLRDVLNQYNPEVIRYFILKTHYRSPLNFSYDNLLDAKNSLTRLYQTLREYDFSSNICDFSKIDWSVNYAVNFKNAMDDDFNTSLAISILFELVNEINRTKDFELAKLLYTLANTVGLLSNNPQQFLQSGVELSAQVIEEMIVKRNKARLDRDFALSDKIRDELLSNNIVLEDSKNGTIWRKL